MSHGGQIEMMHSCKTLNQHQSLTEILFDLFYLHSTSILTLWMIQANVGEFLTFSVFLICVLAPHQSMTPPTAPPRVSSTAGFCWLWKSHKVSDLSCKQPPVTLVTFLHPGKPSLTSKQTVQGLWEPITAIQRILLRINCYFTSMGNL